jgi:two-component system chemotaxis response regulator CheY
MMASDLSQTVIVVDDLPSTRKLIIDMLREMGFTSIVEAGSGPEAIRKLAENKPGLMVCDYVMRGMSGVDVVRQVRMNPDLRRLPVIMLSNNRDVPLIDAAFHAGADDYLVKPISFNVLKRRIVDVLSRKSQSVLV